MKWFADKFQFEIGFLMVPVVIFGGMGSLVLIGLGIAAVYTFVDEQNETAEDCRESCGFLNMASYRKLLDGTVECRCQERTP